MPNESWLNKHIDEAETTSARQRFHASIDKLELPGTSFPIIEVRFPQNITVHQIDRIKSIAGELFSQETLEAVLAVQMISEIYPSDYQHIVKLTFDQCPIPKPDLADFLKVNQEAGRLHNLAPDLKNPVIFAFDFGKKQAQTETPLLDIFVSFQ